MALITCGGADVIRGRIHMPLRGAWWAEFELDTDTAPSGKVKIAADGGLSLTGTVTGGGVFLDSARVNVVGGGGGLRTIVSPSAFQNAFASDPLNHILGDAGESLSPTTDSGVLGAFLSAWTVGAWSAAHALDLLARTASDVLGSATSWRVLSDGSVWMGTETWPDQSMPSGSDVLFQFPDEGRFELGCATPTLVPGVNLADVGHVAAADHFIEANQIRTWAWTA